LNRGLLPKVKNANKFFSFYDGYESKLIGIDGVVKIYFAVKVLTICCHLKSRSAVAKTRLHLEEHEELVSPVSFQNWKLRFRIPPAQ
jgi:hypothetical protein